VRRAAGVEVFFLRQIPLRARKLTGRAALPPPPKTPDGCSTAAQHAPSRARRDPRLPQLRARLPLLPQFFLSRAAPPPPPPAMELRSGYTTGVGMMPEACKPYFEEGARLVFRRWTALALAVEGQWGGAMSKEKANALVEGCIEWFYRSRGALAAACGALAACGGPAAAGGGCVAVTRGVRRRRCRALLNLPPIAAAPKPC